MFSYLDAAHIAEEYLIPQITELYGLHNCSMQQIESHKGGRNLVYRAAGNDVKIIRISFLPDRCREDYLAEILYIRYLYEHGASVANVITSKNGNLLEELTNNQLSFYICLFENAAGESLAEHQYRYREGVPLSEYFYNCGKTLGKMHHLSKTYVPVYHRYDFFGKYNAVYLNQLIPDRYPLLKRNLTDLLEKLRGLDRSQQNYGMVHFDYSDGNYKIDYKTGKITVFDFDNCCTCWYMYDLANLWAHGVGWIQFEPVKDKRKAFMDGYFQTVIEGYRSETDLEDAMFEMLPLFVQAVNLENIVDYFEVQRFSGVDPECDEEQLYRIKCMEADIPFIGFYDDIYNCEDPFELSAE